MNCNIIVAVGKNGEIGVRGDLIWKISDDLKRFKALTTGHPVIMGRKTWESLPKKPLPGRLNIVLSRRPGLEAPGAEVAHSAEEALKLAATDTPFIIGGAEIYNCFLPFADKLYLTAIDAACEEADAFFLPDLSQGWELMEESEPLSTPEGLNYRYLTYKKRPDKK